MLTAVLAAWALAPPRPLKVRTRRNSSMAACELQAETAAPWIMRVRHLAVAAVVVQEEFSEVGSPDDQAVKAVRGCVFVLRSFDPNYKKEGLEWQFHSYLEVTITRPRSG